MLKCLTCDIPCPILEAQGCNRIDCRFVVRRQEPRRANPVTFSRLLKMHYDVNGSLSAAIEAAETFTREENVKPSVMMAAVRDLEVCLYGQPYTAGYHRLIARGSVFAGGISTHYIASEARG